MRKRVHLPSQWVLPIVTAAIVLLAICLPERVSAWRDKSLFEAAHVEEFDGTLGIAPPSMTLFQRIRCLAALNFGEATEAYMRYEDSFTQEENEENDRVFLAAVETLTENGILPLPKEFFSKVERTYSQRLLLWDSVTMEQASFLQANYYSDSFGGGIDLTVDETSGQVVIITVYHPEVSAHFAGTDGWELTELGQKFVELLGFTVTNMKYDADDAYLFLETEEGMLEYHISQRYDVLHIEAMPDTSVGNEMEYDADYETSIAVSISDPDGTVYIK